MSHSPFLSPAEDFASLLQEVLHNRKPLDDLLRHGVFLDRGLQICRWHVRGTSLDAWELFNTAYIKTAVSKDKLHPKNTRDEEAFFSWFYVLALNLLRDLWRKDSRELQRLLFIDCPNEESADLDLGFDLVDLSIDLDGELLLQEFMEFASTLPAKRQRAIILRLENYPDKGCAYEKIAAQMNSEGIECSHVTVQTWVRDSWKAFLADRRVSIKKAVAS